MVSKIVQSGTIPQDIRILSDKVLIATDIRTVSVSADADGETEIMYEFAQTEYSKDEYVGLLREKNAELESEILDTQVALCDVYEMIGG